MSLFSGIKNLRFEGRTLGDFLLHRQNLRQQAAQPSAQFVNTPEMLQANAARAAAMPIRSRRFGNFFPNTYFRR